MTKPWIYPAITDINGALVKTDKATFGGYFTEVRVAGELVEIASSPTESTARATHERLIRDAQIASVRLLLELPDHDRAATAAE